MDTHFSDHKAEHLWEHAAVGLAFVGPDGKWLRVNPYLAKMLGYTTGELSRKTFQQVTHPDDVGADEEMVRLVLEGRIPYYTMTKRYLPKVGPPIWIRLHVTRINDGEGNFGMFLSQVRAVEAFVEDSIQAPPANVDDLARFLRKHWTKFVAAGSIIAAAVGKLFGLF